ncbi:MAG: carboxypeptidase regulatory-like domain-containing protein [Nitrospira sp.]|nr:MAG: carboxypeptidase regulatory-like domain-containing protein [Nitrospira sp.]
MMRAVCWLTGVPSRSNYASSVWRPILALLCLMTISACGDSSPVSPPTPVSTGTVTGRVIASDGTGAIPNATIEIGTVRTTSGADGSYTLSVPVADRTVVHADASGFAESFRISRVTAGQNTPLTVQLVRVGFTQNVPTASGGTITDTNSSAQIVLPANGLVPSTGAPAANVAVSVTPINVSTTTSDMPGDFTASASGSITQIESFGAMLIDVRDSNNVRYSLTPGSTATIRIPVSTRSSNVPATIPLFYFDGSTGRWIQDGQATLVVNASIRYYEGTVSRLGYWNADLVTETIVVTGCVRNASGQPVPNALVESEGKTYSGSSRAYTTTDGSFQIPIRKDGEATITALAGTQLTNTATAGLAATNIVLDPCLVTTTSTDGFSIKLTWGASPNDLDSYLFVPNHYRISFRNSELGSLTELPFAQLDIDDQSSFGPEVVTITKLMQGTYTYAVHNYSRSQNSGAPGITESPGRVELSQNGNASVFAPPAGEGSKLWWHVFNIVVDAQCNVSVTPVNAWLDQAPALSAAGTPTFCTVN